MANPNLTDKELRFLKRFIADSQSKWNQNYSVFVEIVCMVLLVCLLIYYPHPDSLCISVTDIQYQTDLTPSEWVPKAFEKFAMLSDRAIREETTYWIIFVLCIFSGGWVGFSWRENARNRIIAKLLCAYWEKIEPGNQSPESK